MHRSDTNRPEWDGRNMKTPPGSGSPQMPGTMGCPEWRKSSWSANNGNCVEVARLVGGRVGVRDSKDAQGPVLAFSPDAWRAFVGSIRTRGPGS
jgi:Domain of unknown function (DUF397)